MADLAARNEPRRTDSGLLLEFPTRRGPGGLPGLHFPARKLPQTTQESLRGATLYQPTSVMLERDDRGVHVRARPVGPGPRDRAGVVEFPSRPAVRLHGAPRTQGGDREADRLPQLHHRFVEPGSAPGRKELLESRA